MKYCMNSTINFLVCLAKTQTVIARVFDGGMGNGIGFHEFLILYHLKQSDNEQMRRVDLAEKVGITASGITRMLLPMEKIGLVKSGSVNEDARVRTVSLTEGGNLKLTEAQERLQYLFEELMEKNKKEIEVVSRLFVQIIGTALMGPSTR